MKKDIIVKLLNDIKLGANSNPSKRLLFFLYKQINSICGYFNHTAILS